MSSETQGAVEVLGRMRHSRDCVRASLPVNYDRGGVGLTMPPCDCGHDEAVARAVEHMYAQEQTIRNLEIEADWRQREGAIAQAARTYREAERMADDPNTVGAAFDDAYTSMESAKATLFALIDGADAKGATDV